MIAKRFALAFGSLYLLIGVASFIPALSIAYGLPRLNLEVSYGLFLGLFPQNIINKVAILVFGVAGLLAARSTFDSEWKSTVWARTVFVVMGTAAVLGIYPPTSTFFGYWPLWGYEAILHGVNALIAGYFGFVLSSTHHDRLLPH